VPCRTQRSDCAARAASRLPDAVEADAPTADSAGAHDARQGCPRSARRFAALTRVLRSLCFRHLSGASTTFDARQLRDIGTAV
jgi:hypothetical protein